MYFKRSCEGQIFSTNNRNCFDIPLVINEMLYHYVARFKIGSFHETVNMWPFSVITLYAIGVAQRKISLSTER
jgi:hypothetical protein